MSRSFRLPISGRMFGAMLVLVALMLMAPFISGTSLADTGDGDDMTPPVLTIISPTDGSVTNSKEVTWTIIEDGSGIKNYQYKIGDGDSWTDIDDIDLSAFSYTFANLVEGENTLHIKVIDHADNEGYAQVTFFVDTTPPILTIDPLENDGYFNINGVTITWSITDDGVADIDHFKVRIKSYGGDWFYGSEEIADESFTFNDLVDGKYVAEVRAIDNAGNSVTAMVIFTVDTVKPVPAITSPAGESFTNSKTVSWSATDEGSGIAGYQYKLDDGEWSENTTATSYTFTDLADGEHTVHVRVYDHAGNYDDTSVTFTLDTVPPTLTIGSPENGDFVDSSTVEVSWTGDDDRSDVVSYQCRIHSNGAWSNWHDTEGADHFSFTDLIEGEHIVQVRIYDQAGNFAEKSVTFTVDTEEPVLNIDSPADGSFLNNPDVPISWSATDATTVVTRYEYSTDGGETWTSTYATGRTFTSLADGRHAIQVRAYDRAGNFAEASVTFTVDTELPLLNIGSPSNGDFIDSKDVWVSWIATDEGSGIKGYQYRIDSGKWYSTTEASHLFEDLGEGPHTVVIRAIDNAGNSVTAMVTFVVDTVPPSLSITSPDDGSVLSTTWVEISWSATDATTTVTGYEYRINSGGVWSEWSGITLDLMHNFTGLADGQHIIEVRAYDLLGNMAEARLDVTIDTLGPQVDFTSPVGGSCINTGEVTISWTGDDATTAVAGYQYRINGGDWKPIGLAESITLELPDGEYTIEVMAYDIVDNEGITSLYFIMDSTDPTVTIVEPNDGAYLDSGDVHVEWTGDDATSGIKSYQYRINGGAWSENTTATSHIFTGLADGVYVIEVRSWDRSNNSASVQVSVTVDTVPPTIDIESPQEGAYLDDRSITVAWSSTDPASELVGLKYRLDSGAWSELIALQDLRFEGLADGLHTVEIKLFDLAGNNSTATVAFTVDTTKPTLIIDSPIGGAHLDSKDVTVEWSATDATGIAGYQYRIDGGAWSENTTMTGHTFTGLADGKHTVQVRAYDLAGNFVEAYVDLFVDTTDPEIIAHTPSGTGVPVDTSISATFSEEMVHDSLVFTISGADGVISWQGNTATFSPYSDLVFGRTYSVSVYGKDLSGNSVTAQWTFTAVPNGTVSGKIVYKDGSPIANATVSSGGKSVTTDANGEFLIDLVKGQHDLIVSLNGKEIGMFNATTVPGEMNDLGELIFYDTDITLRDVLGWIALAALIALLLLLLLLAILRRRSFYVVVNGIMEGKVLDLKDRPIEGAAVILETGQAAVTDAEGGFSLDVTPRTYGMTVEKDGLKSPVFLVTVAPGQTYTSEVKRMEKGN